MRGRTIALVLLTVVLALSLPAIALAAIPAVPTAHFTRSEGCGCHAAFVEQWSQTMHSKALSDPLYQYKLAEANKATDGALGKFCEDCHGPIAAMAGMTGKGAKARDATADEGITCDFCHQLVGTSEPPANNSWVIKADGVKKAQLKDSKSPAHATAYSAYHEKAEFCGACHNVNHPVNGLALEATYTEWKNSPYAKDGTVCQDCHMTPGAGPTKPNPGKAAGFGPDRPHIYTMTFAGGNVGLGDAILAEERLKAAATLEVDTAEIVEGGQTGTVKVTVTNSGAGHYLPTGLTEVRQCWLEVKVAGADGAALVEDRQDFHTVLAGEDGKGPVELWEAASVLSDTRIPPKESKSFDYEFTMPAEATDLDVSATLYYRSCSEEMAKAAGVEIPTTEMAAVSQAVYSSEDNKSKAMAGEGGGPMSSPATSVIAVLGVIAIIAVVAWFIFRGRAIGKED